LQGFHVPIVTHGFGRFAAFALGFAASRFQRSAIAFLKKSYLALRVSPAFQAFLWRMKIVSGNLAHCDVRFDLLQLRGKQNQKGRGCPHNYSSFTGPGSAPRHCGFRGQPHCRARS
jgi:hypothetical protein